MYFVLSQVMTAFDVHWWIKWHLHLTKIIFGTLALRRLVSVLLHATQIRCKNKIFNRDIIFCPISWEAKINFCVVIFFFFFRTLAHILFVSLLKYLHNIYILDVLISVIWSIFLNNLIFSSTFTYRCVRYQFCDISCLF